MPILQVGKQVVLEELGQPVNFIEQEDEALVRVGVNELLQLALILNRRVKFFKGQLEGLRHHVGQGRLP